MFCMECGKTGTCTTICKVCLYERDVLAFDIVIIQHDGHNFKISKKKFVSNDLIYGSYEDSAGIMHFVGRDSLYGNIVRQRLINNQCTGCGTT